MSTFTLEPRLVAIVLAAAALLGTTGAGAQATATSRATELRADKLANAPVLAPLAVRKYRRVA